MFGGATAVVGGYSTGDRRPGNWDGQDGRYAQLSVHLCNIYIMARLVSAPNQISAKVS